MQDLTCAHKNAIRKNMHTLTLMESDFLKFKQCTLCIYEDPPTAVAVVLLSTFIPL